jgi:hypothetical protein
MKSVHVGWITTAIAVCAAAPTRGQELGVSVNPYLGYYHFDESSFENAFDQTDLDSQPPQWGVRVGLGGHDGFSIDLAYGHASVEGEVFLGDVLLTEDSSVDLFYGALNWHLPLPVDVFVSGGAGAVRYDPEERDTSTSVLVNYGAGVTIPLGMLRLRGDVKDHVDLCDAPDSDDLAAFGACFEDEALHNIEISVGVEIGI